MNREPDIVSIVAKADSLTVPYLNSLYKLKDFKVSDVKQVNLISLRRVINLNDFSNLIGIYTCRDYNKINMLHDIKNSCECRGLPEPQRSDFLTCQSRILGDPEMLSKWITLQASLAIGIIKRTCFLNNYAFSIINPKYNPALESFIISPPGFNLFQMVAIK